MTLYFSWCDFHRAGLLWTNSPKPIGRQTFSWCYKYLFLNLVLTYCYVPSTVLCSVFDFQVQIIKTLCGPESFITSHRAGTRSVWNLNFECPPCCTLYTLGNIACQGTSFHSVDPRPAAENYGVQAGDDAQDVSQFKTRFQLVTVCYCDLSWIALPIPDLASVFFLHAP